MPIYRHDEVSYVLRHSGARISIVPREFRSFYYPAMLAQVRDSAPDLEHVITVRGSRVPGALRLQELTAGDGIPGEDVLGAPLSGDAPHCIIYTSGTESRPKGCLHTLNTVTFTVNALGGQVMSMRPDDVMFMPSPVTHATGLAMGVTAPLMLGAGIHLMDVWEPRAALQRIARHGCTLSMTATPFVQMILAEIGADPAAADKLGSLRCWACAGRAHPRGHAAGLGEKRARLRTAPGVRAIRGPAGDRLLDDRLGAARAVLRRAGIPRRRARDPG